MKIKGGSEAHVQNNLLKISKFDNKKKIHIVTIGRVPLEQMVTTTAL